MANGGLHDEFACSRCERLAPDIERRHWKHEPRAGAWHVIADGANLTARLPREAHFVTVLSYRRLGGVVIYRGALYWEFDAADPADALKDLRRCLGLLDAEQDCPLEAVHVWHSGGRGFHVTVPPLVLGAESGHPQLPRMYAAMIDHLFPQTLAPTLDRGVYSAGKGRMWRLPNRRRENGRYKVPLTIREVLHRPYADLEALTVRPRKGSFWPADDELSPCLKLSQLYGELSVVPIAEKRHAGCSAEAPIPEGHRNTALFHLGCAMRRYGFAPHAIEAALLAQNAAACHPPLEGAEVQAIAAQASQYQPRGLPKANNIVYDPWLGSCEEWHGAPSPIWKEVRT